MKKLLVTFILTFYAVQSYGICHKGKVLKESARELAHATQQFLHNVHHFEDRSLLHKGKILKSKLHSFAYSKKSKYQSCTKLLQNKFKLDEKFQEFAYLVEQSNILEDELHLYYFFELLDAYLNLVEVADSLSFAKERGSNSDDGGRSNHSTGGRGFDEGGSNSRG